MPYIFGKLWHLAIIWAIRKAFQCILQGVRFLLANHARLSPTSENESYTLWSIDCASCFSLANMKYSSLNIGLSLFLVPPFELHKKTTQVQVRSDQWSDIWVMRAMHYPIQPVAAPGCNHSSSRLTTSRWTSSPHNGSLGFWNASLLSPPKSPPWKWKLAKVGKWVDLDFRELFWKRCGSDRLS